jgi:hypothetical protein
MAVVEAEGARAPGHTSSPEASKEAPPMGAQHGVVGHQAHLHLLSHPMRRRLATGLLPFLQRQRFTFCFNTYRVVA